MIRILAAIHKNDLVIASVMSFTQLNGDIRSAAGGGQFVCTKMIATGVTKSQDMPAGADFQLESESCNYGIKSRNLHNPSLLRESRVCV